MTNRCKQLITVAFGLILIQVVTGQGTSTYNNLVPPEVGGGPNVKSDVTDTVMALLNETGYSGKASDANVQEIVAMLMNGTVPTDADLIRFGIIPQPATTPPPYVIQGGPVGSGPSISVQGMGPQTGTSTGGQSSAPTSVFFPGTMPGGQVGSPTNGGFPPNPPLTMPSVPQTGAGGAGVDVFGGVMPPPGGSVPFPSFPSNLPLPGTTQKPALGDPFSMNLVSSGASPQLPSLPTDLNAVGPKPFQSGGPIGILGTPGSPADLLGPLGTGPAANAQPPLQTGILDTAMQERQRNSRNIMNNPMMLMMMMMPEIMEGMMAENPMMLMMMMQQMMKPKVPPKPKTVSTVPGLPMDMTLPGGAGGVGAPGGSLIDMATMAGLSVPPGPAPGGAAGAAPGLPMDLAALAGPGASSPGATGGIPMDLAGLGGLGAPGGMPAIPGLPLPTGGLGVGTAPTAGPAPDMTAILNMVNAGSPPTAPSAAPMTDPFIGSMVG